MRVVLAVLIYASIVGCGPGSRLADAPPTGGGDSAPADAPAEAEPCEGLQCQVVRCEDQGRPATTISGTVFAPNGELELFGVNVYVPNKDPGPFTEGAQCTKCNDGLPGFPIARALTNEFGRFTVTGAPSGTNIPLIVTIGKWRRIYTIPEVRECTDNVVAPEFTRLPKNKLEGDIPKMAVATGGCDALECLIRKLGIDEAEFTNGTGTGRIHLYNGGGANSISDGTVLSTDEVLWQDLDKLKEYDLVLNSCQCSEDIGSKPAAALDAMNQYVDAGGRLFLSHYHYYWIQQKWSMVSSCSGSGASDGVGVIDQVNNPKGKSFALWMQYVMGSTSPGLVTLESGSVRQSCPTIDTTRAERWVSFQPNPAIPLNFQFTTPTEVPVQERCGKVVFSDMHVSSTSGSAGAFPNGCSTAGLLPQEKALSFMFFDIASCVGVIN